MMKDSNIAIIGGGLVGSILACYMQKRGCNVQVYESRGDMRKVGYIGGRSINLALSQRGWSAIEKIGLRKDIEEIAIPMYGRVIHQRDGSTDYQPYGKENEAIYSVSRGELNKRLVELADNFENVTFHFDEFCTHADFENNKAIFKNNQTQTEKEVNADVVFATDGAYSKVRMAMQGQQRFNYWQHYIDYGYKELSIPAGPNNSFLIEKNALHIWPRGSFMLIALPNIDGSFTCTLFVPFEGENAFDDLTSEAEVRNYFETNFPDAMKLMPTLVEDFFKNPTSSLMTIRCFPWHKNNFALVGDAAHAVVPFFGQGMNCGFEDVRILDELMDSYDGNLEKLLSDYEDIRKENADAISQMALDNFTEMRDLVGDKEFLKMKHIEHLIMENPIYNYTSMYQFVSFTDEPYKDAMEIGKKQYAMLREMSKDADIIEKIKANNIQNYFDKYLK